MHDPLEMFLDSIFAQIHSIGYLLIGESEHKINDDHLLAFGQVITLLHAGVWAFEFLLIQLFHDDQESAVFSEGFIRNTEDRKSTRLNSSHQIISYAVFC